MKFSWFLALRYLKPKRTFISIITVISIAGVALGVGVLIVVIAVMSGFEKRIKDEWLKVEPPLYLHDSTRRTIPGQAVADTAPVWRELLAKVRSFPGVESASPFLNVVALVQQARPQQLDNTQISVEPPAPPEASPDGSAPAPVPAPGSTEAPPAPPAGEKAADAPPEPAPDDATPDAPTPEEEAAMEAEEARLDRSRPFTEVTLMGVDLDDVNLIKKRSDRFQELLDRRPFPQALGEFDVGGMTVVLSDVVVNKADGHIPGEYPTAGQTVYNLFGPAFIKNGIQIMQDENAAKSSKEKQEANARRDRDYPLPEDLTLTGIFTDDKQQAAGQAAVGYISLKTAQRLAGAEGAVDGIFVDLGDPYDALSMAEKIKAAGLLPPGWVTETWVDRHRQQFEAVENERGMMYIVLGFISLVAAFCIMNTMITMAVQKRREIGMMRALGAKTSHIVSLFMTKGFIVGLFGTGLGYLLGRLVLYFRNDLRTVINDWFGHQIFDAAIYGLNEIPAELRTLDQVMICGLAFILCTLAAVPPAFMVGRMEPARALRNDR